MNLRDKTKGSELRVGVGLRREHFGDIENARTLPDWFEILSENHFRFGGRPLEILKTVAAAVPVVAHGVALNIGGPAPLNQEYLDDLARLCETVEPPWISDHLCFSGAHGYEYQDLIPLPFCQKAADHVADRIRKVQEFIGLPFALENPSYYMRMPGSTMSEADFITRIVESADCGLLLDVNNVYVNGTNHGYDPWTFMESLPLDRVLQLHMAGHHILDDGMLFDTHGKPVPAPVWSLFEQLIRQEGSIPTLIEWDNDIPAWDRLLQEANTAERILSKALSARTERPSQTSGASTEESVQIYAGPQHLDLGDFFDRVAPALDGRTPVDQVAEQLFLNELGTKRLSFYSNQINQHATSILEMVYPDTRRALGVACFQDLAEQYSEAHPMNHYEWNQTACFFPEFLTRAQDAKSGARPPNWAHALASLEWDWFATHTNPAPTTVSSPGIHINPTLLWLSFAYKVASWSLEEADSRPDAPEIGEESVIMFRHPKKLSTRVIFPGQRDLLAMKMVAEDLRRETVQEMTGASPQLLEDVLNEGVRAGYLVRGDAAQVALDQ